MINNIQGPGIRSILDLKPQFYWDAFRAGRSSGLGIEGDGNLKITLVDNDSRPVTDVVTKWDPGQERWHGVTVTASPEGVLGPSGNFYDGYILNSWSSWTSSYCGFAVVAPTPAGALYTNTGVYPDIIFGLTHCDEPVCATDGAIEDVIVERSITLSATYRRVFQVLVKSEDGNDPVGNVYVGINSSAGTRVISASTWIRPLPGLRGWYAVLLSAAAGSGTRYVSISFKMNTGRWFYCAPMWFSTWSTMENVTRPPLMPANSRGGWYVTSTNSELIMRPEGWLAMSVVLPDRSVSNGHLDLSGAANYRFLGLLNLECVEGYRLRVSMSDTYDHLTVSMGTTVSSTIAFLDLTDDWNDFSGFGIVATWEISNGTRYVTLYCNGIKGDSVSSPADWWPDNLTPNQLFLGISASSGTLAECWIPRMAMGRQRIHRSVARTLSKKMYDLARGKID